MGYRNLNLNEDTEVFGVITYSSVSKTEIINGRPKPIYTVSIKAEIGLSAAVASLYRSCLGPNCVNYHKIADGFENCQELTFESICKPCVSGFNPDTMEFEAGTPVRVSCRFEAIPGVIAPDGSGEYMHPRLMLRFVDACLPEEPVKPEPLEVVIPVEYDF